MKRNFVLTDDQREYAAEHHNLIYKFLSVKKLDKGIYYDIVAPGYLRAVVNYDTREDLKQYKFTAIAWRAMNSDLYNYWRYLNRKKRKSDVISLDMPLIVNENFSWHDTIISDVNIEQSFEDKMFWLEVYSLLDKSQIELIQMRLSGHSKRDISKQMNISKDELDIALLSAWNKIKGLFGYLAIERISENKDTFFVA